MVFELMDPWKKHYREIIFGPRNDGMRQFDAVSTTDHEMSHE
jgi:hypothetical protein